MTQRIGLDDNGALFGTPAEFVQLVEHLLLRPDPTGSEEASEGRSGQLRDQLRANALAFVERNHSYEKEWRAYDKLVREVHNASNRY